MAFRQLNKPIKFFCLSMGVVLFSFFLIVKIWGKELLVEDSYRQNLIFSEGMTVREFGEINELKSALLKSVFRLASENDLQKRLGDLNLTQEEILNRVNEKLALQAKRENVLIKGVNEVMRRLLHNFGFVTKDIQRSGQPIVPVLWLHYKLFPFKSVINLAWEPDASKEQVYEKKFCEARNVDYYTFSWDPGGLKDWGEVDKAMKIMENCRKPVWIHCKGGKDRTGGLVAIWKKKKGYPMKLIFADFEKYHVPAFRWVQQLFVNSPSNCLAPVGSNQLTKTSDLSGPPLLVEKELASFAHSYAKNIGGGYCLAEEKMVQSFVKGG
jgi:hypothetical protein